MKRFSEQFKNKAESIRMSASEKRELRERVVSYMEYHPLPTTAKKVGSQTLNNQSNFQVVNINTWRLFKISGSFVIVLLLGVSLLAERAVPGDALYAVKVGFNEEMRSTLARGSYEKVVWETERLNRRIAEAKLLADEGRLTTEVEEQVADAVRIHSENARKEIENLKLTDKDEATMASIELATALDVQTTSLRNRGENEILGQTTTLIETVLVESQAIEVSSVEDELPAYDKLMAKVESETTRAYELLEGIRKSATEEEQSDIKRRLEDIERKIASSMQSTDVSDIVSREGLVEVLQQTHRLIVFMTNIDVRESVTVDEIVPVTLTNEERLSLAKKQVGYTINLLKLVRESVNATSSQYIDADILNKIEPAIEQSSTTLDKVLLLIESNSTDIETIEGYSLDAYNIISDSALLLKISVSDEQIVDASTENLLETIPTEPISIDDEVATTTEQEIISTSTDSVPEVIEAGI